MQSNAREKPVHACLANSGQGAPYDRDGSINRIDERPADLSSRPGVEGLSQQKLGGDLQAQSFDRGEEAKARAPTPLRQRSVDDRVDDLEVATHRGRPKRSLHDISLGPMVIEIAEHEAPFEQLADREIPAHAAREIRPAVEKNLAYELRLANRKLHEAKIPVREVRPEPFPARL